jgi:hypothetical protein
MSSLLTAIDPPVLFYPNFLNLVGKDSIGWHSDDFPQSGKRPANR